MSTTFGVKIFDGSLKEIALRYYGGKDRGSVVQWRDPVYELLPEDLEVTAMDNTSQGVSTVGDLKKIQEENNG